MTENYGQCLTLFFGRRWFERCLDPVSLTAAKIFSEIPRKPELHTVQLNVPILSLIHFVSKIRATVVLSHRPVIVVSSRLGSEVALAEHRATTGLDDCRVERPLRFC